MKLSTKLYLAVLIFLAFVSCNSVSRNSIHTNYLPARTTYVRFHNFPATQRTSLADSGLLLTGHWSCSSLFISLALSRGNEILIVCELIVNPNVSIVESQFVRFFRAKIGDTRSSPGPNKRK